MQKTSLNKLISDALDMLKRLNKAANRKISENTTSLQSCSPPLELPIGVSERELFDFVTSIRVEDAPENEMKAYGEHDFRRFVYTFGLAKDLKGRCLELGSNPYFTTLLLRRFTELDIFLANYFSDGLPKESSQVIKYRELFSQEIKEEVLHYKHFNIERDPFPYPDETFDVVIFAEIIEHLQNDPCQVLREIKRVLKPRGTLILTTPNIGRLENITRIISGANIYDPYSGYGPYGRHNREYNRHELDQLLRFEAFEPIHHFTADVHGNNAGNFFDIKIIAPLLKFREDDLGQYIFLKALNSGPKSTRKRPAWLFRSYPADELT